MELPHVGQFCSQSNCNLLDFLPLVCECHKCFCSKHFNLHVQTCGVVLKPKEADSNEDYHRYVCSNDECQVTSLVPLICDVCKQHFCVEHRHISTYHQNDQEKLAAERQRHVTHQKLLEDTKIDINKQVEAQIAKAKKKDKNRTVANKVQLMRLKNKATGQKTIPIYDRLYFNVRLNDTETMIPVFVSKTWSLGRAIDAIALECNIPNNNNKANAKKLRLFKEGDVIVSEDMSNILSNLLQSNVVHDGEDLAINYTD